jgi:hypothetical protein
MTRSNEQPRRRPGPSATQAPPTAGNHDQVDTTTAPFYRGMKETCLELARAAPIGALSNAAGECACASAREEGKGALRVVVVHARVAVVRRLLLVRASVLRVPQWFSRTTREPGPAR